MKQPTGNWQIYWDMNLNKRVFINRISLRTVPMVEVVNRGWAALDQTPLEEAKWELKEAQRQMLGQATINQLLNKVYQEEQNEAIAKATKFQHMNYGIGQTLPKTPYPGPLPKSVPFSPTSTLTQQQIDAMKQKMANFIKAYTQQTPWTDDDPFVSLAPLELLLCVASYTDRIPASVTYTVSLEWLRCRTSKDSDWHSCSLVKSGQHIRLWEKDFILTQITPPGLEAINEVVIGCRLNSQGHSRLDGVFQVRLADSEDADAQFLCMSDLR